MTGSFEGLVLPNGFNPFTPSELLNWHHKAIHDLAHSKSADEYDQHQRDFHRYDDQDKHFLFRCTRVQFIGAAMKINISYSEALAVFEAALKAIVEIRRCWSEIRTHHLAGHKLYMAEKQFCWMVGRDRTWRTDENGNSWEHNPGWPVYASEFNRPHLDKATEAWAKVLNELGGMANQIWEQLSTQGKADPMKAAKPNTAKKGKNINSQMLVIICTDSESIHWSASQWAQRLGCVESTVKETHAWQNVISASRAMHLASKADDEATIPKRAMPRKRSK